MRVETVAVGNETHVALEGAHSVSWAYLLDLIYADAYHQQVDDLHFIVGHPGLHDSIRLRADLTRPKGNARRSALAELITPGRLSTDRDNADVIYTVEYGKLSARALRRNNPPAPTDRRLVKQYSVFTWQARALGVPIRLASMCRQPHLFDRFMKQMLSVFLRDADVPAYYHLKIWT